MDNHDEAIQLAIQFARSFLKSKVVLNDIKKSNRFEEIMERSEEALEAAARDPNADDTCAFDALVSLAAYMMRNNERLPDWMASFAADVLEGKRIRPTKRGPDKYKNWLRDYSIWRAVDTVAERFSLLRYTNNDLCHKTMAAEIVAEAAGVGVDTVITACKKFNKLRGEE